jgi:membrane protease YdiL (CAAX protease family)
LLIADCRQRSADCAAKKGPALMEVEAASPGSALMKPIWLAFIGPAWVVSLVFYFVVAAIRFFAFLSPYEMQHIFFLQTVAMWALPFLLLTANGRREIGLSAHAPSLPAVLLSFVAGSLCALVFFTAGMEIYGNSPDNWCISIRNYLHLDEMRGIMPPAGLFALYALPAIFLNPIGEELLFRGFMQQAFARRFNPVFATIVSSLLFGILYLCLHGLSRDADGFHLRLVSAAVALLLMASVGVVFTLCRILSASLWPAMASHAAFNLTLLAVTISQFAH